jgi:hypothetical protein
MKGGGARATIGMNAVLFFFARASWSAPDSFSSGWQNTWDARQQQSPRLPSQFSMTALANRQGLLSVYEIAYDYLSGTTLTKITDQLTDVKTFADERSNETTYIYDDAMGTGCEDLSMHSRILRPDFLASASYAGDSQISGFPCECWHVGRPPPSAAKNHFVKYCNRRDSAGREPVRLTLYDGTTFDVIAFKPGLGENGEGEGGWKVPDRCFFAGARNPRDDGGSGTSGKHASGTAAHTTILDAIANTRLLLGPMSAACEYERRMLLGPNLKKKKLRSRVVVARSTSHPHHHKPVDEQPESSKDGSASPPPSVRACEQSSTCK